jgi:hypothetical protein
MTGMFMSTLIGETIIYALEEVINIQEQINQTLLNSNSDDQTKIMLDKQTKLLLDYAFSVQAGHLVSLV